VTPAPSGARTGNRVTALRWAALLRRSGHGVRVEESWSGGACDVLVALHALKSAPSLLRFRRERPDGPALLVLTGTDLYSDLRTSEEARRSLQLATRLVVLNPRALDELSAGLRAKARVVLQSAARVEAVLRDARLFEVCVLGHLREVKDPFLAARAARGLPADSRVRIVQVGAALSARMRTAAQAEAGANPRYRWLGGLRRGAALRVLAGSRLLLVTSRNEGGPSVVPEAIACGLPLLSTRIPAAEGLLGADHPGLFAVGDEEGLRDLLARAESDGPFLAELARRSEALRSSVDPERERRALEELVDEVVRR